MSVWTVQTGMFLGLPPTVDDYTEAITSYISFCVDCCIPSCTRVIYNNGKPWFTAKFRWPRFEMEEAFRRGGMDKFKEAKYRFNKVMKQAKRLYSEKLQQQFLANNTWRTT